MTEEGILNEYRRLGFKNPPAFADLATLPPKEAWTYYTYYYGWNGKYPELIWKASLAMANNDAIAEWLDAKIMAEPYNDLNNQQAVDLKILGTIPAVWSAKLLGKYIYDERKMEHLWTPEMGDTPRYGRISGLEGLAQMGFWDAPTDDMGNSRDRNQNNEAAWKAWWEANKDRLEARIAEINPGYKPNHGQAIAMPTSTPKESTSKPAVMAPPVASSTPTINKTSSDSSSSWLVYASIAIAGLLAGVAMFFVRRK